MWIFVKIIVQTWNVSTVFDKKCSFDATGYMQRFPNDFHNDAGKPWFTNDSDIIEASLTDENDTADAPRYLSLMLCLAGGSDAGEFSGIFVNY